MSKRVPKLVARETAWRKGYLRWRLFPYQRRMSELFDGVKKDENQLKFVLKCSRRIGKTDWLVTEAIETALRKPGAQIKYAAADAKAVESMIKPAMNFILRGCPEDLVPKTRWSKGEINFPNGSQIRIAGCDEEGKADALRGQAADLCILDEAGFIGALKYTYNDVLLPQLLTTGGKFLVASSPAKTPGHYFRTLCEDAKAKGALQTLTIWEAYEQGNTLITPKRIQTWCEESGGEESTTWRREYLCEDIIDSSVAVCPSWDSKAEKEIVVDSWPRPSHFDAYSSHDPGYRDGAGWLGAYWDYKEALLVVEDERLLFQKDSGVVLDTIMKAEKDLWGEQQPYKRVMDYDLQQQQDYLNLHGVYFLCTDKTDKELQCNNLDLLIRNRKIRILSRCKQLIRQLNTVIWNKQRTSFERDESGHGDLIDALVYLVRNVDRSRNPFPAAPIPAWEDTHFGRGGKQWYNHNLQEQDLEEAETLKALILGRRW